MDPVWDLETQEFHGGQSWRECPNFIADFSVTTTPLGAPPKALQAAQDALKHIHHYPNADASHARTALAKFCNWRASQLLVGNGASEFIDMLMKALPPGPYCPAPYIATYQEYHRAARAAGREMIQPKQDDAEYDVEDGRSSAIVSCLKQKPSVMVFIRPNSPTGECISLQHLQAVLDEAPEMKVIVDESFLPFAGKQWNELSALHLIDRYPTRLIVVQSWTKLWSCAGLRLGSMCAGEELIKSLKKIQTPWSCNSIAQAFAVEAVEDRSYLCNTWKNVPLWREMTAGQIQNLGWQVMHKSCDWVPWLLVKCPSKEVAAKACKSALSVGCPVRYCASYGLPQYIRIAVRQPKYQEVLFSEWKKQFPSLTYHISGGP